ncbi:hypothetical protein KQX54_021697 [Cotesia glomerata]|uniref:Odorant receptor n=1 Tax=Cotesia glomerata TaxID=32391 RepID=A0AAV7J927_COTGL|nr:hypothetical protein KQX54_021697 [Cotesia glomerata]
MITLDNTLQQKIKNLMFTMGQVIHLFFECFLSQQLTDMSQQIHNQITAQKWQTSEIVLTISKMDIYEEPYYIITKGFASFIGQWPYQSRKQSIMFGSIMWSLFILQVIPQVVSVALHYDDEELLFESLSPFITDLIFIVKYVNVTKKANMMKTLFDKMKDDWKILKNDKEKSILENHMFTARYISLCWAGRWPFQTSLKKFLIGIIINLAYILQVGPKILADIVHSDDREVIFETLAPIILDFAAFAKYINTFINAKMIKNLLERIKEDWRLITNDGEKVILKKHAGVGKLMATGYIG